MFIITNRNIDEQATGSDKLGPLVNAKGPAELRIVEAVRKGRGWEVDVLPDEITPEMKQEIGLDTDQVVLASEYLFRRLLSVVNPKRVDATSRKPGKNLLFFVHGFNNSFADVLERCEKFARQYDLEVVAFTWPANGGGIRGVTDYLDDKRDAQASVVAFDRVLAFAHDMLRRAREEFLAELVQRVKEKFPDSAEKQRDMLARESEKHCPFNVSLLLHSMGNYLLERTLKSSALRGDLLIFDNIVMAAADVNNEGHAEWVEKLKFRNRLYVTINEDDSALQASRIKGGDEQLARLGQYRFGLTARQAIYVDFTDAPHVGRSHAYFEDSPLKNPNVLKFFTAALHGLRAEDEANLAFDAAKNMYRFK